MTPIKVRDFSTEIQVSTARSSGPGGQNVNKVNTKVELRFHIIASNLLTEQEKHLILHKLKNRITTDGELIVTSQTSRSQLKNKDEAMERLYALLEMALTPRKKRKPTKPTKASVEERLSGKKILSEKKSMRRKIE